jgi:hypothetical protein
LGSLLWSALFTLIGYAAGEAAVRAIGRLGRVGEIVGALVLTAAVFGFVKWNRQRAERKAMRRRGTSRVAGAERTTERGQTPFGENPKGV